MHRILFVMATFILFRIYTKCFYKDQNLNLKNQLLPTWTLHGALLRTSLLLVENSLEKWAELVMWIAFLHFDMGIIQVETDRFYSDHCLLDVISLIMLCKYVFDLHWTLALIFLSLFNSLQWESFVQPSSA